MLKIQIEKLKKVSFAKYSIFLLLHLHMLQQSFEASDIHAFVVTVGSHLSEHVGTEGCSDN